MKKNLFKVSLFLLCLGAFLAGAAIRANAEDATPPATEAPAPPPAPDLTTAPQITTNVVAQNGLDYVWNWFRDNTNFWGQKSARIDVAPLWSNGRAADSSGPKENAWGAAIAVQFPLDEMGQASIGFFGAYFNSDFFAGSINTTIGKTVTLPLINQPVFIWAEGGPAINLNTPDKLEAQAFTGATWKTDLGRDWSLYISGGIGTCSAWDGNIFVAGLGIGKKF